MDDGIPVNSATFTDEETWFELIGTAGRTFSYAGGFAEAASTELCKGNVEEIADIELAPVVQRLDNAIHRINHYLADSVVCFVNPYPLDSDLSGG